MAAIRLLILIGCRKREILHLRWDQVDFEAAELVLPKSKTGPRKVSLSPRAVRVLESIERVPDNPWVVPGRVEGTADAQHRRSLGSSLRARRAQGHTHPRLPALLRLPSRGPRREPSHDRKAPWPPPSADHRPVRTPCPRHRQGIGRARRGQHRRGAGVRRAIDRDIQPRNAPLDRGYARSPDRGLASSWRLMPDWNDGSRLPAMTIRSLVRDLRPCLAAKLLADKAPAPTTVTVSRLLSASQITWNSASTVPSVFPLDNNARVASCDGTSDPFSSFHSPRSVSFPNRPSPSRRDPCSVPLPAHGEHRSRRIASLLARTLPPPSPLDHACPRSRSRLPPVASRKYCAFRPFNQSSDLGRGVDIARGDSYALRCKA